MTHTTETATALFDSLPPATEDQMIGHWRGAGFETGHPMDGLLTAAYWHGKVFEDAEAVHPLVHKVPLWGEMRLNPALLPIGLATALPFRDMLIPALMPVLAPLLRTRRARARLRTVQFRGRAHATMVYDHKPINDVFAVMDADTRLGWMDYKGMAQPFFFVLHRIP